MEIISDLKGERIDNYLLNKTEFSRSKIQKMIKASQILVNGKTIKCSYLLQKEDIIDINVLEENVDFVKAEDIKIDIVYEDDDVIVINKENGMVVHPAIGNNSGTLVNALLNHSKNLSDINGEFRPGIVHRIDAYTTGLLVVAKNNKSHEFLAKEFQEKKTYRKYVALVWGVIPNDTGTIDAPIGRDLLDRKKMCVTSKNSKKAITHFKVLERYKNSTLIELMLETGRTHQIRVHMNYIGYPIVNDPVYGHRKIIDDSGQCLHAKELGFIHPTTGKFMKFDSELPFCFVNVLNIVNNL